MDIADLNCIVNPLETSEYPTPARRPNYSVLNKKKIKTDFGIEIPHWESSLIVCLSKLL
jgi:dTDP-4-dehydrorhamnose reductase